MSIDHSKEIFDKFYADSKRMVRVTLKDGRTFDGRFIGFFKGDEDRNELHIFRWHFLLKQEPIFDYDKTIDPDHGIFIEQNTIHSVEFI